MFCKNCGKEIDDNAAVCAYCGRTVNAQQLSTKPTNKIAVVGFVFSFLIPLVGLICSIIGVKQANERGRKGFAIAGIVISILNWIGGVVLITSGIL